MAPGSADNATAVPCEPMDSVPPLPTHFTSHTSLSASAQILSLCSKQIRESVKDRGGKRKRASDQMTNRRRSWCCAWQSRDSTSPHPVVCVCVCACVRACVLDDKEEDVKPRATEEGVIGAKSATETNRETRLNNTRLAQDTGTRQKKRET